MPSHFSQSEVLPVELAIQAWASLGWFQQEVLCVLIIWTSDHLHLPLSPVSAHTGEVVQRRHSFSYARHCQGWWSLPQLPHVHSGCSLLTSPLSLTCCAAILWVQALLPDVSGLDYLNDSLSSDKLTYPSNLSLMNFCLWVYQLFMTSL